MPLWAQLEIELRRRLDDGDFEERFPTQQELTELYGISRHTVREAVRELNQPGLLRRERGRGTIVNRSRFEQTLGPLYSLFQIIESAGVDQTSEVLTLEVTTDPAAASRMGIEKAPRWCFSNGFASPVTHPSRWIGSGWLLTSASHCSTSISVGPRCTTSTRRSVFEGRTGGESGSRPSFRSRSTATALAWRRPMPNSSSNDLGNVTSDPSSGGGPRFEVIGTPSWPTGRPAHRLVCE